jgi:hypothetical protein
VEKYMKEIKTLIFADLHNYPKEKIENDLKQEYDIIFLLGDINNFYLKLISNYAINNNIPICIFTPLQFLNYTFRIVYHMDSVL